MTIAYLACLYPVGLLVSKAVKRLLLSSSFDIFYLHKKFQIPRALYGVRQRERMRSSRANP